MDSGYQGYQDDHSDTEIPYKRIKNNLLHGEQKAYNHALSRLRVRSERAPSAALGSGAGRMKRFRILADR